MTFRFQEGDEVVLKNGDDHAELLPAGSIGIIFCQYMTNPPAYEVNFRDATGKEFGSVMYEEELEPVHERFAQSERAALGAA